MEQLFPFSGTSRYFEQINVFFFFVLFLLFFLNGVMERLHFWSRSNEIRMDSWTPSFLFTP